MLADAVQLQDAVTTAHETSTAFSDEVIKEHDIFELSKQQEMKEMLQAQADGQVEMFQRVSPTSLFRSLTVREAR